MSAEELPIPAEYRRKGTWFVRLPALSAEEGRPAVAQVRRLRGRELYLVVGRSGFRAFKAPPKGATEEEVARANLEAVDHMRAVVVPAALRILLLGDPVETYRIVDKPVGDHAQDEISVDAFEPDISFLGGEIIRLSVPEGAKAGVPRTFRGGDAGEPGDPGPARETVRAAAE